MVGDVMSELDKEVGGVTPDGGDRFFIVGVGASAGGLEALSALISRLPADLGASYVIVQHMSTQSSLDAGAVAGTGNAHAG